MAIHLASYGSINAGLDDEPDDPPILPRDERRSVAVASLRVCLVFMAAVMIAGVMGLLDGKTTTQDLRMSLSGLTLQGSVQMEAATNTDIPFPYVDRTEYSSLKASDIVNPDLFGPALRGSNIGLLKVPFPTGAFWTNLVLIKSTSDQGNSYPIMAYPYAYRWSPSKLQVSYPPLRRLIDPISIRDIFNPDLTLHIKEKTESRQVTAFDPLSVTLRYSSSNPDKYWETYLVQGSPYVTMAYQATTPILRALSIFKSFDCADETHCSQSKTTEQFSQTLQGFQFQITTLENLTWLLFASTPITLTYDTLHKTTISADAFFTGVLRLVLLPPPLEYNQPHYTSQFPSVYPAAKLTTQVQQRLACHANVYPVGGNVSWKSQDNDKAKIHFQFETKTMSENACDCTDKTNQLLMLALPHHVQVLKSTSPHNYLGHNTTFRTIKGTMTPVVGDTWTYQESLTTIGFDSPETLQNAADLPDQTRQMILDQVQVDMHQVLPTLDENVYGFGKQIARVAQLAHIASVLEGNDDDSEDDEDSLTLTITKVLHQYLSAFLLGENKDKLLYDTNFGGIISRNGLTDSMDDFGNGWYNDHLFHYGYVLYASAVLGKLNSTFMEDLGDAVDALLLDVANPTNADSRQHPGNSPHGLFPFTRHKSWFDSHSFASGLFPFADGKSMESSGESVNFYYGAYLWTMVRSDNKHKGSNVEVDFARLLLAMEIRGVKTYWHMVTPDDETDKYHASDIYNPLFSKNFMVGNVGMMDVTVATWFGIEPLYVHMINFLPVTAITKVLFAKSYVEEEFTQIIKPTYDNVQMAWKGYVVCDRAMVDPNAAWEDALDLRSNELDQAISQSQVLYFASTMDGFVALAKETTEDTKDEPASSGAIDIVSASCQGNKACAALGLTGNCCPAANGAFLGCCDASADDGEQDREPNNSQSVAGTSSDGSDSCEDNKACAALGLTGSCCPAASGAFLGCCGGE